MHGVWKLMMIVILEARVSPGLPANLLSIRRPGRDRLPDPCRSDPGDSESYQEIPGDARCAGDRRRVQAPIADGSWELSLEAAARISTEAQVRYGRQASAISRNRSGVHGSGSR